MSEFMPKALLAISRKVLIGLLVGPLLFALVVVTTFNGSYKFEIQMNDPLTVLFLLMAIVILPVSIIVPKKQAQNIKVTDGLQKKLSTYQLVLIQKAAFWEGIALFGIVLCQIQENLFPLTISLIAILIIASLYPNVNNIQKLIPLDPEDIRKLS